MSRARRSADMRADAPACNARLFARLRDARAVILTAPKPPYRAVSNGDARRRPMAWVDAATVKGWHAQGLLARSKKGWTVLSRPGPRPLLIDTPQGRIHAEVRENWMQRLARDLDLPGPLAEAGHRLVADGLRVASRAYRSGTPGVRVDGSARADGEERRTLARLDARRRLNQALGPLGMRERAAVEGVCIHDRTLVEVARAQSISEPEAESAFRLALLELAVFYGTLPGSIARG